MGDRENNIQEAIKAISMLEGVLINKESQIYETDPVGYTEQDKFLNMVIMVTTYLEPLELLDRLQDIEALLKRNRIIHWGPRTIDLDILLYGDKIIEHPRLIVPHREMLNRAFVLIPLKDVAGNMQINEKPIDFYIKTCNDKGTVKIYT